MTGEEEAMAWEPKPKRGEKIAAFLESEEGRPYLEYAKGDAGYAGWLACVDAWLESRLEIQFGDVNQLGDYWRNAYLGGVEPTLAAMNTCTQEQLDAAYVNQNS